MATRILLSKGPPEVHAWRADAGHGARGGVVVVQEIFGVNDHIRRVVDGFAADGFTAIAPAMFDLVEADVELDYDAQGIARGRELASAIRHEDALDLISAAAATLGDAGKVAVVGYCWGGTLAYLSAIRLGLPAVSYYGGGNTQYADEPARAPLMFHYGERDAHISAADRDRVRQANPDAEFHVYPAGHGFNCDVRDSHDPVAAALARKRTLAFLDRQLR